MTLEVDYDKNMTLVYQFVSAGSWDIAVRAIKRNPEEARTWVVKRSPGTLDDSDIECRLLPIHSACALQPPPKVVIALVDAYPQGVKLADNQGMYPLHYACSNLASKEVVQKLLVTFPDAINIADPEGMLPLHHLAQWGPASMSVLELLLQYCDNKMMATEDLEGNTALDLAYNSDYDNREEVISAFEEFVSEQGSSPMNAKDSEKSELSVEVVVANDSNELSEKNGRTTVEYSSPTSVRIPHSTIDESMYKSVEKENEILKSQLSKMSEMCADYKFKAQTSKDEVNAMTEILTEYKAKVDRNELVSREKIGHLKRENDDLQSMLKSMEEEMNNKVEIARKENETLKSEVNALEEEVLQLSSSLTTFMKHHQVIMDALSEQKAAFSRLSILSSVNSLEDKNVDKE